MLFYCNTLVYYGANKSVLILAQGNKYLVQLFNHTYGIIILLLLWERNDSISAKRESSTASPKETKIQRKHSLVWKADRWVGSSQEQDVETECPVYTIISASERPHYEKEESRKEQ